MLHREMLPDILDPVRRRDHRGQMRMRRHPTLFDQGIIGQFNRRPRRQHRIDHDQHLSFETRRRDLLQNDLHRPVLAILSERRHERIRRIVKHIEESVVHRHPRPEDRRNDDLIRRHHDLRLAQRRHDRFGPVVERLADFVGHHLPRAFEIPSETHRIPLRDLIAQLRHVARQNRIFLIQYPNHIRFVFELPPSPRPDFPGFRTIVALSV